MSLFTNTGEEAKKSAETKSVDLKTVYIRLKENESVRVRLLGVTDYVEYMAHGDFNLGIYTQPCLTPATGEIDPLCIAAKSGVEGFEVLRPKKRYIFAFYDIDKKIIRFWDASKTQASRTIGQISDYADSIEEISFNFKRTGTKTETSYDLNPILKLDAVGKEGFASGNDLTVELANFESVLIPRSPEAQIEALKNAGFPVDEFFAVTSEATGIDIAEDENPLDVM